MSFANLKNDDFTKASLLVEAAEKNNCKANLCLVSYFEEGYGDSLAEGSNKNIDEIDYKEIEVVTQELTAHCFISSKNEKIDFARLTLKEKELLAEIPLRQGPGRKISISEATGNEGATKELWYQRAAIIIWARERELNVLLRESFSFALQYFEKIIQVHDVSKENHKKAVTIAKHLIEKQNSGDFLTVTESLISFGDKKILVEQIKHLSKNCLSNYVGHLIVMVLDRFSWQVFEKEMFEIFHSLTEVFKIFILLRQLFEQHSKEGRLFLIKWFQEFSKSATTLSYNQGAKRAMTDIFYILVMIGSAEITKQLLLSIENFKQYPTLPYIYAPAVVDLIDSWKEEYDLLSAQIICEDFWKQAQLLYPTAPKPPENCLREGQINCTCDYCQAINRFLLDPNSESITFTKTSQKDLKHVKTEIANHGLDLDLRYDWQWEPPQFNGIITKNQKSYERALERYVLIDQTRKKILNS